MKVFIKKIFKKKDTEGFTLVELLVAASILISAVGAPLYVGVRGIMIATEAESKIVATFLAEEGIEMIRNQRDTNLLKIIAGTPGVRWDDAFGSNANCLVNSGNEKGCVIGRNLNDFPSTNLHIDKCPNEGCPPLQQFGGLDIRHYGYGGTTASPYTRTIRVQRISADEISASSTVEWLSRGVPRKVEVEEHLFSYGFD